MKDCRKCVHALNGCWEDGSDYCFRDKESLIQKYSIIKSNKKIS